MIYFESHRNLKKEKINKQCFSPQTLGMGLSFWFCHSKWGSWIPWNRNLNASLLWQIAAAAAAAAAAKSPQLCPSVRPHRRQPTRLPHPWGSPGKNTGVGCHFLLQCMKVKSESEVAQLCQTLSDPMDCSLPGSSFHGIFQARELEWVAIWQVRLMLTLTSTYLLTHLQGSNNPFAHFTDMFLTTPKWFVLFL